MDFCWSGSASYGRFLKEMGEIAKVFGAQVCKTAEGVQYYKYYEPIPEVVVGWLDCPYDYFPPQRTKAIWEAAGYVVKYNRCPDVWGWGYAPTYHGRYMIRWE